MYGPKIKTNKKQAGQEGFEEVIKARYDLKKSLSPAPRHKERQELRLIRLTLTEAQRRLNLLGRRNFRKTKDRNNYMKTQKEFQSPFSSPTPCLQTIIHLRYCQQFLWDQNCSFSRKSQYQLLALFPACPHHHHHHHVSPLIVLKSHGHPAPMFKNSLHPTVPLQLQGCPFHCLAHEGLSLCASHFTNGETEDRRLCDFPRVTQLTEGSGSCLLSLKYVFFQSSFLLEDSMGW